MFTSSLVLSFVSLKFVSHAAVTCNSVELGGTTIPELVCMTQSVNNGEKVDSRVLVCDGQGGAIANIYENALDCTGTVTRTEDPCFESEAGCTYTAHCGGEVCTYTAFEQWEGVTQCNGDVPAANAYVNYTKMGMVIDTTCVNDEGSSVRWGCSAQSGMTVSAWTVADCAGDPWLSLSFVAPGCDTTEGFAGTVDCNAVAPSGSGSGSNAPTTSPIESGAPTKSPSPMPTASPVTNAPSAPTTSPVTGAPTVSSPEPTENPTKGPTDATGEPSAEPTEIPTGFNLDGAYGVKVSSFITLFVVSLYFMAN